MHSQILPTVILLSKKTEIESDDCIRVGMGQELT